MIALRAVGVECVWIATGLRQQHFTVRCTGHRAADRTCYMCTLYQDKALRDPLLCLCLALPGLATNVVLLLSLVLVPGGSVPLGGRDGVCTKACGQDLAGIPLIWPEKLFAKKPVANES